MKTPTKEQQLQWLKEEKCHICGSDNEHSHPRWMWMANPAPGNSERAKIERKINKAELKKVIFR